MEYRTCQKCGVFSFQPPQYVHDYRGEALVRVCGNCGYVTREPTADKRKPPSSPIGAPEHG